MPESFKFESGADYLQGWGSGSAKLVKDEVGRRCRLWNSVSKMYLWNVAI